jgi:hypothetical protein
MEGLLFGRGEQQKRGGKNTCRAELRGSVRCSATIAGANVLYAVLYCTCFCEGCRMVVCGRYCATVARRYRLSVFRPTVPHGCLRYGPHVRVPALQCRQLFPGSGVAHLCAVVCGVLQPSLANIRRRRPSTLSLWFSTDRRRPIPGKLFAIRVGSSCLVRENGPPPRMAKHLVRREPNIANNFLFLYKLSAA